MTFHTPPHSWLSVIALLFIIGSVIYGIAGWVVDVYSVITAGG